MEVLDLKSARMALLALLFVFLLAFAPHAFALSNGQAASLVIGVPNFTTYNPEATSTGLIAPYALAFDSGHNLWVADTYGNKILEYTAPFSTHEAASLVIGQPGFTTSTPATSSTGLNTPVALAFDSSGNLWVVDSSNARVLEYTAPFSTHEAASLVIGQPGFTTSNYTAATSTGLNSPYGLAFDSSGNLWVADLLNGRVLEYTAPFSTHEAASLVIGEPNFTASNDEVSKRGLNAPNSVTFDSSGNLWVVDGHRVLEYAAPLSTYEPASLVIGQNNFTNSSAVATSTGLDLPSALAFDSGHNLWVSDTGNNRVLEYAAPLSTGEAASLVIGQQNFTGSGTTPQFSPTSTSLNQPKGLAFDSSGNLWVADFGDARVLQYGGSLSASSSTAKASSTTTSSTTSTTSQSSTTTQTSTSSSTGGGGGVPEFPYQFAIATAFTVLLAASYLLLRRRTALKGHVGQEAPASS